VISTGKPYGVFVYDQSCEIPVWRFQEKKIGKIYDLNIEGVQVKKCSSTYLFLIPKGNFS